MKITIKNRSGKARGDVLGVVFAICAKAQGIILVFNENRKNKTARRTLLHQKTYQQLSLWNGDAFLVTSPPPAKKWPLQFVNKRSL